MADWMREYSGVEADLYDHWFADETSDDDAYFREQMFGSGPTQEISCGTGRLLLPHAGKALLSPPVDSSEMLAVCRADFDTFSTCRDYGSGEFNSSHTAMVFHTTTAA